MQSQAQSTMSFAALDFETATASRGSACSVGVVVIENGAVTATKSCLIQPPGNIYDPFNVSIHGITPEMTAHSASFDRVWPALADIIQDRVVIAHNAAFDISVLRKSAEQYSYVPPPLWFACSYRLAKETWPERWSYRLNDLAKDLGIPLDHHDALSDAHAAASIIGEQLRHHEVSSVDALVDALGYRMGRLEQGDYQSFSNAQSESYNKQLRNIRPTETNFDQEHPLFRKKVAFTGTLSSMTRAEATQKVVDVGASTTNSVGASLDFLVVGDSDCREVRSGVMSAKLRKAVALSQGGHPLEIIDEEQFLALV